MKKFRAIMLACLVAAGALAVSCQKNEDLIVGRWKVVQVTVNGEQDRDYVGNIIEFTAEKKVKFAYLGQNVSASYSIDDETITGSLMGQKMEFSIDKLTKKELQLTREADGKKTVAMLEKQ